MKHLLLVLLALTLSTPVLAEEEADAIKKNLMIPTGVVRDEAPFNKNPTQMAQTQCQSAVTNCTVIDQTVALAETNDCAQKIFNVQNPPFSTFEYMGDLENCATPSEAMPVEVASGKKLFQWPVCCYHADEEANTCKLYCGLYMDE